MKLIPRMLLLLILASVAAFASTAIYAFVMGKRYASAYEKTEIGEPYAAVVRRFGKPSIIELPLQHYREYAQEACHTPCNVRVWWEYPYYKKQAWSVEFDAQSLAIKRNVWELK